MFLISKYKNFLPVASPVLILNSRPPWNEQK